MCESNDYRGSVYFVDATDRFFRLRFKSSTIGYLRYREGLVDGAALVDWHYFLHPDSDIDIEDDFWGPRDDDELDNLDRGLWIVTGVNGEDIELEAYALAEKELEAAHPEHIWQDIFNWPTAPFRYPVAE
ncbi:MAG: hypothetical protein E6Q27_08580 [Aeromicrobium sp.]|nr:MAG: hypothetical protein E6Q27_08580 [Aeromicrobium sp.]